MQKHQILPHSLNMFHNSTQCELCPMFMLQTCNCNTTLKWITYSQSQMWKMKPSPSSSLVSAATGHLPCATGHPTGPLTITHSDLKKQLIPQSNIWTENSPPATTSTPSSKHLMTPQFKTVKYNMYYSVFRMVVRQALESIKPLGKEDMQFSWHFFSIVTDWQFDLFMNVFHHSCVHNKWWQKKYCTWTNTRAVLFHHNLLEGVS